MKLETLPVRAGAAVALVLASITAAGAQAPTAQAPVAATVIGLNPVAIPLLCPNAVTQDFPTGGAAQTTWLICWREVRGEDSVANPNGLVIGPVYLRRAPNTPFARVLWDMRVSEYFVPYHNSKWRFYDLSVFNFKLAEVTADDCPAKVGGGPISPRVCKEVRDRGLMWKDFTGVRRGEELVLWGALDAANYRYIQEYTFRDDGVIIGRLGATGLNWPPDPTEPHTHNAIWRLDIDLGGVVNNAARPQHYENTADANGIAADKTTPITTAQGFTLSLRRHDVVEVSNPILKNKQGNVSSYHLVPLVTGGLTQHFEKFTQKDFWVTPYNPNQFAAKDLAAYVAGSPSVTNRDIVVWYKGSLHHHPRDEDGVFGPNGWVGTAHAMWAGFMLVPHNLFDCSLFYQPCP
jgi:Cu2+-containing amine oxidase